MPRLTRQMTKHVVTRWYRAPELILLQDYTYAVDMWSVGCIFSELLSMQDQDTKCEDRVALFPGQTCYPLSQDAQSSNSDRLDQLNVIFAIIGTPDDGDIEKFHEVKDFLRKLPKKPRVPLRSKFPKAESEAIDLLERMLEFNPSKRITVEEALHHAFLEPTRERFKASSCPFQISMEFENQQMDIKTIKELVFKEAMSYRENRRKDWLVAKDIQFDGERKSGACLR